MQQSVDYVQAAGLQGSTTACVLTVDQRTGQLHAVNLGDSGFLVLGPAKGVEVGGVCSSGECKQWERSLGAWLLSVKAGRPRKSGCGVWAHTVSIGLVSQSLCAWERVVVGKEMQHGALIVQV
eukprot:71233-Pelagomonas_calceolata.AAC.4